MNFRELKKVLENEPSFRLKQVKKAVFKDLIDNWRDATTLPQNLRQKLQDCCLISELKLEKILNSKDGQTIKALFKLKDYNPPVTSSQPPAGGWAPGFKIESVLMKHKDGRRTVCLSSQAGCAMGCQFCATGQQGLKRNLSSSEMIDQVLFFARLLKKDKEKIDNVVFMGMGEPFLNYGNVLEAIRILNDKEGFNLGARHISISTCGIAEGIKKLAEEKLQINLAISLHAPTNELRLKLMPITQKYPIEKILTAVDDYIKKTKRRVMFEYLMINGVNDSEKEAKELIHLLKKPLYFVNLISFNPIGHSKFKPSPAWKIKKFKELLEKNGLAVTQRYRFGQEIKAACGQLVGDK